MIERKIGSRSWPLPLAALMLLLLLAHHSAPAQTDHRGLIADGPRPDLILMYTGDVIGYIDPCG